MGREPPMQQMLRRWVRSCGTRFCYLYLGIAAALLCPMLFSGLQLQKPRAVPPLHTQAVQAATTPQSDGVEQQPGSEILNRASLQSSSHPELPEKAQTEAPKFWKSSVVVIPAVYREWESGWPDWTNGRNIFLYQRTNASAPNYAPNHGLEGGVYLKFLVDFYDKLPDIMVFVHANPLEHNPDILQWIDCLAPTMNYTSLNTLFIKDRGVSFWNHEGIVPLNEACWRALAAVFGLELTPEVSEPVVSCYCCQQFAISRAQIKRFSRKQYKKAYKMMAGSDYCYRGTIDPDKVWSMNQTWISKDYIEPEAAKKRGATTQGDAMEHLVHFLLGGEPLQAQPYGVEGYCRNFVAASACPGSPCDHDYVIKRDSKYDP